MWWANWWGVRSLLVEHVKAELLYGDLAYLARNAKSMFRKRKATALESLTLTN
jgi:hypothetical protein